MKIRLLAALAPLVLGACTSASPLPTLGLAPAPDDPSVAVRALHPAPVTDGYTARLPIDPQSWRQLNDDRAPGNGGGS